MTLPSSTPGPGPSQAPVPVPAASAVRPSQSLRSYSITGVARVLGYGILVMFILDLPAIIIAYLQRPLDPQMDATVVAQILERITVPLIAFGFIFGWEAHELPRWERVIRKLMSYVVLVASVSSLILSGIAISSGVRLYNHATAVVDFRANQRATVLTQLSKQLPNLGGETLRATYVSVVHPDPSLPTPSTAEMRKQIAAGMPAAIDALYATAKSGKAQGRRDAFVATGKYAVDALIAAVLFFVLWEASYSARVYRIFRQKDAPDLGVEAAVIGSIGRLGRKIEAIRILPNWEDYAWYRRIRRKWRHRKDHKHR